MLRLVDEKFLAFCLIVILSAIWMVSVCHGQAAVVAPPKAVVAPPKAIESIEPASEPSLMERVDAGFAKAVDAIASVLFRRLFATDREYVQMDHAEDYVRDVGSHGDFEKYDPNGEYPEAKLTPQQVDGLGARGMLVLGNEANEIRRGKIGDRQVEYVVVELDQANKYVLVKNAEHPQGEFQQISRKRELLKPDKVLTWDQVDALAAKGWLKTDPQHSVAGKPYLLKEKFGGAPIVVLWLAAGSVFFTFYMGWFNFWGFRHAVEIVRGRYDNPNEPGEVTHLQALASALSATVGLGNIAGVTIAMTLGGPGAFFWMVACGVFGMTSKFVECTLGQKYRTVKPDGTILGGPMQYLHVGLKELGLGPLGLVLSVVFSVMCIMASFGGGNMFQANQSGAQLVSTIQSGQIQQLSDLNEKIRTAAAEDSFDELASLEEQRAALVSEMSGFKRKFLVIFGIVLAVAVGFVIIGGIKRIGAAAEKVVPTMCLVYIGACLWIIMMHITDVPALVVSIFSQAFTGQAFGGGIVGVMVLGIQRAAFSNEAGVGSAAIAHSAAKTDEPVREGAVALLGPFIDTVVVCSMTALVILITNAWDYDPWVVDQGLQGAALTSVAFEREISWFPYVLAVAVVLFAFSTIISWSYYGERCWERLFGARSTVVYRCIYVTCVFIGAIVNLGAVLDFSDMMILSMAFPNVLGVVLLSPKVKRDLADYWRRYKAGEFKTYK
ncbi:MAG: alanine/glycine:cation symporter family protein [Pirellulaceae bacterium]|nr:alanine/glycine:cation symporter family protein [Pirellulaceae bacterium]